LGDVHAEGNSRTPEEALIGQIRAAFFDNGDDQGYLSHFLGLYVPVTTGAGHRRKPTFQVSYVDSFSDTGGLLHVARENLWRKCRTGLSRWLQA